MAFKGILNYFAVTNYQFSSTKRDTALLSPPRILVAIPADSTKNNFLTYLTFINLYKKVSTCILADPFCSSNLLVPRIYR